MLVVQRQEQVTMLYFVRHGGSNHSNHGNLTIRLPDRNMCLIHCRWTSLFYGDHTSMNEVRTSQESLDTQVHRQDKVGGIVKVGGIINGIAHQ